MGRRHVATIQAGNQSLRRLRSGFEITRILIELPQLRRCVVCRVLRPCQPISHDARGWKARVLRAAELRQDGRPGRMRGFRSHDG